MLHGKLLTMAHVMLFLPGAQLCPKCFSYMTILCPQ